MEAVPAATGPWQVGVGGAALAWYHHWSVWSPMVSVAVVKVTSEAVRVSRVRKVTESSSTSEAQVFAL